MTPEQFNEIQRALSYDNAEMAKQIGLSERMVAYMKVGQKRIVDKTTESIKDAINRKIVELKVLHKCIK
jgi:hypothetical protein